MNELSLFTGAGGGLLGTKLLGFNHIGYVEINEYCQKIIAQRIKDGILDEAPIFGDIRTFISEGYAESYQGMVDVITAGFPCQPFSVAGKRQGDQDERNMWPATIDVIRTVRPRFALLENVPGLLAHEYARTIFRDLAESGFDARWDILGASDVGAPHRRKRVWIFAYSQRDGIRKQSRRIGRTNRENQAQPELNGSKRPLANSEKQRQRPGLRENEKNRDWRRFSDSGCAKNNSNTRHERLEKRERLEPSETETERPYSAIEAYSWWAVEPDVGRVADGIPFRVDRLKAIGNGQVSRVVATAWRLLTSDY